VIIFPRTKYIRKLENSFRLYNLVYIIWPRQVWKTTLAKQFLQNKNYLYLSLDVYDLPDIKTTKDFIDYFRIYEKIDILQYERIFLDEVKSFKNIWNAVKGLIDVYNKKIICSSLGSIKIVESIVKDLTGRYDILQVFPLSFDEFLEWYDKNLYEEFLQVKWNLTKIFFF